MTPLDPFTPWSEDGAERLRAAATELADAVLAHAEAVVAASRDEDITAVIAAMDGLVPAVVAHGEAQFALTGNGGPFGALAGLLAEEDEASAGPGPARSGICAFRRSDHRVTDVDAVMAAGRAAHLTLWPEAREAAAAADVTHLGRALHQVAHAEGWEALGRIEGLRPTGAIAAVFAQDELLGVDPDEWPDDPFCGSGELLHRQDDIYPGSDG